MVEIPTLLKQKILLLALTCFLVGCTQPTQLDDFQMYKTETSTPKITSTSTNIVSISTIIPTEKLPTATMTQVAIVTPTLQTELLPFPTLTWTPIPTLLPNKALTILQDYYSNNGDCELPCWWGITPGVTSWQEARGLLSNLDQEAGPFLITEISRFDYYFEVPIDLDPTELGFFEWRLWIKDGVVFAISTNSGWIERGFDYSLAGLLETFGIPEEIWIKVYPVSSDDIPHYELDLFYQTTGVIINSTGKAANNSDIFTFCPRDYGRGVFPPGIILFSTFEKLSFKGLLQSLFDSDGVNPAKFYLLREITDGFDEERFYKSYVNSNTETCIDIFLNKMK